MPTIAESGHAGRGGTVAPAIWFLVGHLNSGAGGDPTNVPVNTSPFTIGRSPEASLCLPFRTISSRHAEIVTCGGSLLLRDLGSTNGTYVSGQRVHQDVELRQDDLIQFADVPLRLRRQASDLHSATLQEDVYDQALALVQFDKLMSGRQVTPYYQPIVDLLSEDTIGYEVLGRSPLYGIETPSAMFRAASKLNLEAQLSSMLRWEGILQSSTFARPPHLFVNTHPRELCEGGLVESLRAIREVRPTQTLTLEIHEAAVTDATQMTRLQQALAELNIRLAYDDFGAGQARLVELAKVRPAYLKFDIELIRNIDKASAHEQQMVASLVKMVRELGVVALAEGVEREAESEVCRQLGFQLCQGFYFGKPAPGTCF